MGGRVLASDLRTEIENITNQLVEILSVNGTPGEVAMGDVILAMLRTYPYFRAHPEKVWSRPLPSDPIGRKNLFAWVKGEGTSPKTLIFHAHLDTVGIEEYGHLLDIANHPDDLLRFFQTWDGNPEIREEACSGDWMFGRGAVDMKSGIAVHLANVRYFSEHRDVFDGNILFMVNADEETQNSGIMDALDELIELREREKLHYLAAINTDYTGPLYPGDAHRYLYTGVSGKVLPCFYVFGRETHVGQTLTGIDPTLITSELNLLINHNMDLAERVRGEMVLPPSVLFQRDTRDFYNVQTPAVSLLYFNYMLYENSPARVLDQLRELAEDAVSRVQKHYEREFQRFMAQNALPPSPVNWEMRVYSFEEYVEMLGAQGVEVSALIRRVVSENPEMEQRMLSFRIVDEMRKADVYHQPCIVIFFAPPYCPPNDLPMTAENHRDVHQVLQTAIGQVAGEGAAVLTVKRFFPYLSDSCYLASRETDEHLERLTSNFPAWNQSYHVPIEKMRTLNIPALNVGVYGKDAHRWTERVFKPYSFETVPLLIRALTKNWLSNRPKGNTAVP